MNKNIIITDADIDKIENKLLKKNEKFDLERRKAIKYVDNVDIIACAGSGKTTLMCAKIDILTKKLKNNKNQKGIAILSLTNVAVNEIEKKLGINHEIYQYPNCCETIQKFIGEYIFRNWYISKFGKKLEIIDDDSCEIKLREKINIILKKKIYTLERKDFRFNEVYTDGTNIYYKSSNIEDINLGLKESTSKDYKEAIINAKRQLIKEGIFNYKDVFIISLKYLRENVLIKKYIENRFEYVIIDEMQDVRNWEYDAVKELFENIKFQKIGDPNQQIYDNTVWNINNKLEIKNSLRNSINIAQFANKFEVNDTNMIGIIQNDIKVKFIVFGDGNIHKVKEAFAREILKNKLDKKENCIFKMVGAVVKKHDSKITLSNYIVEQEKLIEQSKMEYTLKNNLNKYSIFKAMLETLYKAYQFVDIHNKCGINNKNDFFERVKYYIDNNRELILSELKKKKLLKKYVI